MIVEKLLAPLRRGEQLFWNLIDILQDVYKRQVYDLASDSHEIRAYLNGQSFTAEGEKGWYLITTDGYSIGWGKLAGGMMKNHYPKGLRKNM